MGRRSVFSLHMVQCCNRLRAALTVNETVTSILVGKFMKGLLIFGSMNSLEEVNASHVWNPGTNTSMATCHAQNFVYNCQCMIVVVISLIQTEVL